MSEPTVRFVSSDIVRSPTRPDESVLMDSPPIVRRRRVRVDCRNRPGRVACSDPLAASRVVIAPVASVSSPSITTAESVEGNLPVVDDDRRPVGVGSNQNVGVLPRPVVQFAGPGDGQQSQQFAVVFSTVSRRLRLVGKAEPDRRASLEENGDNACGGRRPLIVAVSELVESTRTAFRGDRDGSDRLVVSVLCDDFSSPSGRLAAVFQWISRSGSPRWYSRRWSNSSRSRRSATPASARISAAGPLSRS